MMQGRTIERISQDVSSLLYNAWKEKAENADTLEERNEIMREIQEFDKTSYRIGPNGDVRLRLWNYSKLSEFANRSQFTVTEILSVLNVEMPKLTDMEQEMVAVCSSLPEKVRRSMYKDLKNYFAPTWLFEIGGGSKTPSQNLFSVIMTKRIDVSRDNSAPLALRKAVLNNRKDSKLSIEDFPAVAEYLHLSVRWIMCLDKTLCYANDLVTENIMDIFVALPVRQQEFFLIAAKSVNEYVKSVISSFSAN